MRLLLKSLGPGIITGAADDDPSGIATYSIAGAQLGTKLLWTVLLTWPLMAAVQMMCARIGKTGGPHQIGKNYANPGKAHRAISLVSYPCAKDAQG